MLHLIGKTVPNFQGVERMFPDEKVPHNDPMSVIDRAELHTFWTLGFPFSQQLLQEILNSGSCQPTWDQSSLIVSGNILQWHEVIRYLLQDERKTVRQFATLIVQTFPDLFKGLGRNMNSDGTIALRK